MWLSDRKQRNFAADSVRRHRHRRNPGMLRDRDRRVVGSGFVRPVRIPRIPAAGALGAAPDAGIRSAKGPHWESWLVRGAGSVTCNAAAESGAARETDGEPAPFAEWVLREGLAPPALCHFGSDPSRTARLANVRCRG